MANDEGETHKHCSVEVLASLESTRKVMRRLNARMQTVERSNDKVIELLEHKLTELIDALRGKDMMPVATFRWLVIFIICFTFVTFFGTPITKDLLAGVVHLGG